MSKFFARFFVLLALASLVGCAAQNKRPKSSVQMYEGESPTIHYSDQPETAGGAFNPY